MNKRFVTENTNFFHRFVLGEALAALIGDQSGLWPSIMTTKLDSNIAFGSFYLEIWPIYHVG
jgi:hypothetical protein